VSQTLPDAPPAALLSVVYASAATVPFSEDDLAVLLAKSRRRNRAAGVTGLLVHAAGQFMQVLEGPEAVVRGLLARIAADPRHTGVWVLAEERIPARRFADWAMGFRSERNLDGVAGFNGSILSAEARDVDWTTESRATQLIDWFRRR
jgi:hypothetical protein